VDDVQAKIDQALKIIIDVGMPRAQQNERSALCLLALLDMEPTDTWQEVKPHLIGITPIMDFAREHYHKDYAPNTRETFRRQSMHQFVQAGIALYNPDDPTRPVNSPKAVYEPSPDFIELVRMYGTSEWAESLAKYLEANTALAQKYDWEREQVKIPVQVSDELVLKLSSGDHSLLIKDIIEEFAPRFVPGSELVYVGDTGSKWNHFNEELLSSLGVAVDNHGKMPDVILYYPEKDWLVLAESVTSHGPVDGKRYEELSTMFASATCGLVYITALPSRSLLSKYLPVIAWETEVWVSESPSHLIHFNGDKFLGPHENTKA
jgi:hypothetical protein